MKKWFILALMVCVAAAVQAEGKKGDGSKKGKKELNKEEFCVMQKRMAEKNGKEYNQAAAEQRFEMLDKNKDGKLSASERPSGKNKGKNKDKNKGGGKGGKSKAAE